MNNAFFFKENKNPTKQTYTFVDVSDLYSPEKGYGFVTEKNRRTQDILQIPEITSGFIPVNMDTDRPIPTIFRADVEKQGNYLVEIEADNDGTQGLIFLERRRLYYIGEFEGTKKFSFYVNVCDFIPRDHKEVFEDRSLDFAWIGEGLRIQNILIKEAECTTVYIAGDSTVTDQPADYPYSPGTSYSGWGQMLPAFIKDVAVSNHSHSGLSTETFRNEGHYSIVEKNIKPGDFIMFQFGHNDQKLPHLKEDTGYRANLKRFVAEMKEKGAYPIIVTSLARNTWFNNGESYNDLLEAYANECIRLGKELNIPVVDLHQLSMELIKKNGLVESKKFFHPGDLTHTNDYGAYIMAGFVAKELARVCKEAGKEYEYIPNLIKKDVPEWEIVPELLVLPTLKNEEKTEEEPYQLVMDRLEEIIRGKNK